MKKILFIDTLTTGMNTERCAIYRLGGIYTEDGVEKERIDLKVRPFENARINDQSLWIGRVDRSIVLTHQRQDEAFAVFAEFLGRHVDIRNAYDKIYLAGFNISAFDVPFIWEWFRRNGNERFRDYFHMQNIDLISIAAFGLMDQRRGMNDFKLESVARELGIDTGDGDTCDCLQNARTALEIFWKLQYRYGIAQYETYDDADLIKRSY